jgi:hypothetical protein
MGGGGGLRPGVMAGNTTVLGYYTQAAATARHMCV